MRTELSIAQDLFGKYVEEKKLLIDKRNELFDILENLNVAKNIVREIDLGVYDKNKVFGFCMGEADRKYAHSMTFGEYEEAFEDRFIRPLNEQHQETERKLNETDLQVKFIELMLSSIQSFISQKKAEFENT